MELHDLIAIGEIIKPQGIRGEVKVIPLTDNPERFGEIRRVFFKTNQGLRELFITGYRLFQGYVLLRFEGIPDLTAAENLGRGLIHILRNERPQLPMGRFYYDEIEGLQVVTLSGELLGKIIQIIETGSNDVYVVEDLTKKQVLIPALKSVIKEIRLEEKRMVVELPPGLVEEN